MDQLQHKLKELDQLKSQLIREVREVFTGNGFDVTAWSDEELHAALVQEPTKSAYSRDAMERILTRLKAQQPAGR